MTKNISENINKDDIIIEIKEKIKKNPKYTHPANKEFQEDIKKYEFESGCKFIYWMQQNDILKNPGDIDRKHLDYLAKRKGFENHKEHLVHLVNERGFETITDYQNHLANKKGFRNYIRNKYDNISMLKKYELEEIRETLKIKFESI